MVNQDATDPQLAKRDALIDSVVAYSSSGRLRDQDSAPPTPKLNGRMRGDPSELVTMQDFFRSAPAPDSEAGGSSPMRNRSNSLPLEPVSTGEGSRNGSFRQKFAGMVRRSSLGLALIAANGA